MQGFIRLILLFVQITQENQNHKLILIYTENKINQAFYAQLI